MDAIIAKRLLAKETTQSLLYSKFLELSNAVGDSQQSIDDCKPCWENFAVCIETIKILLDKLQVNWNTVDKQNEEFEQMKDSIRTLIAQREKETEELRKTLSEEKSNKQNKEEYNSIASIVTKLPSRKESELEIENLEKEISKLESETSELEEQRRIRANQFHLVLFGIGELCKQFDESKNEKSKSKKRKLDKTNSDEPRSKKRRVD